MKKWIRLLMIVVSILVLGSGMVFCSEGEDKVLLQLDGKIIETDVEPIIEDARTLVPYRALLEAMGAEISWNAEERIATAILEEQKVEVTIDDTTGFVNGVAKEMDVPPRIVNSRTMIPVRFVLENLKCGVDWDSATRTVIITSKAKTQFTEISSIDLEDRGEFYRIKITANDTIGETKSFVLESPDRYGIDIKNAVYKSGIGKTNGDDNLISSLRFSQFSEDIVRIVADLNEKADGKMTISSDKKTISIDFAKPKNVDRPVDKPKEPEEGKTVIPNPALPKLESQVSNKLIVIDPGHGGSDPGAEGRLNGKHAIWEKELNLPVALRLYDLLNEAGANVSILRKTDKSMSLYSRPDTANSMKADLLVSIHNNACEIERARGIEVLYSEKSSEVAYGFTSRDVASYVQKEMVAKVGLSDRGIKSRPELAVLRRSVMPAIIIEGGFLSNPDDLKVMLRDDFIENYAYATAIGIIKALNATVK